MKYSMVMVPSCKQSFTPFRTKVDQDVPKITSSFSVFNRELFGRILDKENILKLK